MANMDWSVDPSMMNPAPPPVAVESESMNWLPVLLVASVALCLAIIYYTDEQQKAATTTTRMPTMMERPYVMRQPTTTQQTTTMTTMMTSTRPPTVDPMDVELANIQYRIRATPSTTMTTMMTTTKPPVPAVVTSTPISSMATAAPHGHGCGCHQCQTRRHHHQHHAPGCGCHMCTRHRPSPTPVCNMALPLGKINYAPFDAWRHGKPCRWGHPITRWHLQRPTLFTAPLDWRLMPPTEHHHHHQ